MTYNEYCYKAEKYRKSIYVFCNEMCSIMFDESENSDNIDELRDCINKSIDRYLKLLATGIV